MLRFYIIYMNLEMGLITLGYAYNIHINCVIFIEVFVTGSIHEAAGAAAM